MLPWTSSGDVNLRNRSSVKEIDATLDFIGWCES